MIKLNHLSALILLLVTISAYTFSQETKKIEWCTNFKKNSQLAKKEKKPILLFFHGSDWCPPCILMQKEVFSNAEFISFVSEKILFQDVDFPSKKKLSKKQLAHNAALKKRFNLPKEFSQGFPQVVIIDANGKVLYQEKGYAGEGTQKLIAKITSIITQ